MTDNYPLFELVGVAWFDMDTDDLTAIPPNVILGEN